MLLSWIWPMSPRARRRCWRRSARTCRTLRSPAELHISVRTVESHVSALLRKLDASDRQALAAIADRARMGQFVGLPASMTTFVGRSTDRAAILAALDDSRLVTVVGPGGVGKTRLVAMVADGAQSRFPAGGAFVDLVPVRAGSVLRAVADALDATEGPARSVEAGVFERLRVGRPLLVLDNCEHVIDDVSELVERVLAECPHATLLATSRQRLGVTGERLVHLHPLDVAEEAEQLFLDRARAADPDFAADPATVAELCSRLDGMPLAIELAAARAASLGADGLLAGLDDQLRLLAGGRSGHERHHSLRAVIGWSYDRLDDDERVMFRRLSAFVGAFDLAAAAAVSPGVTRAEAADVLGRLVDKSLVARHGLATRWRMLDTIRAFGASQVAALGEVDVGRRAASHLGARGRGGSRAATRRGLATGVRRDRRRPAGCKCFRRARLRTDAGAPDVRPRTVPRCARPLPGRGHPRAERRAVDPGSARRRRRRPGRGRQPLCRRADARGRRPLGCRRRGAPRPSRWLCATNWTPSGCLRNAVRRCWPRQPQPLTRRTSA